MKKIKKSIVVTRNCLNLILDGVETNMGARATDKLQIGQNSC
jgi:hypothetical protein